MIISKACLSSEEKRSGAQCAPLLFRCPAYIKNKPFSRQETAGEGVLPVNYLIECGANKETILAVSSREVNFDGMNLPL